jgi:TolB-like protein
MLCALRALSLGMIALALMAASASAAPNATVVVVYPLTATGAGDLHAGEQIASVIGKELAASDNVQVREAAPGVARQDYLEAARKLGADYYLSGFVTLISGQLSVVEQLVSTLSNTTVWSNDARLATNDDARAQADLIRGAVLGHTGRALVAFDPGTPNVATRRTASGSTRPSFAVLLTRGDASENDRAYADAAIVKALRAHGFVADLLSDPAGDLAILGPAICATTGVQLLLGGTVSIGVQPDREINQWATARLDLAAYDCTAGRSLRVNSGSAATYNWNWAVDQAVAVALKPLI